MQSEPCLGWFLLSTRGREAYARTSLYPLELSFFLPPECADPSLAIKAVWTFRDLGVSGASLTLLLSPPPASILIELLREAHLCPPWVFPSVSQEQA